VAVMMMTMVTGNDDDDDDNDDDDDDDNDNDDDDDDDDDDDETMMIELMMSTWLAIILMIFLPLQSRFRQHKLASVHEAKQVVLDQERVAQYFEGILIENGGKIEMNERGIRKKLQ